MAQLWQLWTGEIISVCFLNILQLFFQQWELHVGDYDLKKYSYCYDHIVTAQKLL